MRRPATVAGFRVRFRVRFRAILLETGQILVAKLQRFIATEYLGSITAKIQGFIVTDHLGFIAAKIQGIIIADYLGLVFAGTAGYGFLIHQDMLVITLVPEVAFGCVVLRTRPDMVS